MQSLPLDLIPNILYHLTPSPQEIPLNRLKLSHLSDLKNCCLISHSWLYFAQPLLFRRLIIRSREKIDSIQSTLKKDRKENERLCKRVEEVWIGFENRANPIGSNEDIGLLRVFDFGLIPDLRKLKVEKVAVEKGMLGTGLCELVLLGRYLVLGCLDRELIRVFRFCRRTVPNLKSLSLSHLHLYDPLDHAIVSSSSDPSSPIGSFLKMYKASETRHNTTLTHLELGQFFYGRHHFRNFLTSLNGLESLGIVESLVMDLEGYLDVFTGLLTRSSNTYTSSIGRVEKEEEEEERSIVTRNARPHDALPIQPEALIREQGLRSLSLFFSPGWFPNSDVAKQASIWLRLLTLSPPTLTHLTLSLLTLQPWLQLFIKSIPSSITNLTIIISPENESDLIIEHAPKDLGMKLSRCLLDGFKMGYCVGVRWIKVVDREGRCGGGLCSVALREELGKRGIELDEDDDEGQKKEKRRASI